MPAYTGNLIARLKGNCDAPPLLPVTDGALTNRRVAHGTHVLDLATGAAPWGGDVMSAVGLSLGLSFIVTFFPARRAARMNPVEALRYE